jgi:hypothetical protein
MILEAPTVRPDLIGKTIVEVVDPFSHGNGRIPPSAIFGEIIVAEADYAAIRYLGSAAGLRKATLDEVTMDIQPRYELFEPGERLEDYLPGFGTVFGKPDYVLFRGSNREKWQRERDSALAADDAVNSV